MNFVKGLLFKCNVQPLALKSEEVDSEEKLLEKVSECMKKILPNQKMELTFKSVQNPHLISTFRFGCREEEFFKEPDFKLNIVVNQPLEEMIEERPSEIRYNLKGSLSEKESGENWSYFSRFERELTAVKTESSLFPLDSTKPVCFWEIVDQISIDSKKGLFLATTSDKLQALAKEKLQEMHPTQDCATVESGWISKNSLWRSFFS